MTDSPPPAAGAHRFEQLIFSGGGVRCFWHGGFLEAVRRPLAIEPDRISGASGGALSAACFIARREEKLLDVMGEAIAEREVNVSTSWDELQDNGLTPHQQMYCEVVEAVIDEEARQAIADGPAFEVLIAHPPSERFPQMSAFPAMAAYVLDLTVRSTPHMKAPELLGADRTLVDARQAARDGLITDLICSAAVIPPVFEIVGWEDRVVIDGGLTSKAPIPTDDSGKTLVLLTRKFRNLPDDPRLTYVEPSDEVPADKIDFTDRDKIVATWEAGRRDGEAFLKSFDAIERLKHGAGF